MSICTRTGDDGTTGLMYNRRVPKTDPRIEACGTIDEFNAALGLARATSRDEFVKERLLQLQTSLIDLMGELGVFKEDLPRYVKDGFKTIGPHYYLPLEACIKEIESGKISFRGWATPGQTAESAALDLARTVARRAERRVEELFQRGFTENRHIQIFLNRTSDLLWLLARRSESIQ